MNEQKREALYLISTAIVVFILLAALYIGHIFGHVIDDTNDGWQPLYWAPNERVLDDQGVPLLGRVVRGSIEISREE
jgi:hypothetical protein